MNIKFERIDHITIMNAATVLQKLGSIDNYAGHTGISIESLAAILDISVSDLVSLLTELEHKDEITMNICTIENAPADGNNYTGTVRLMRHMPEG
ncbi:hypothetical protein GCM10023093_23380 [Nemorincola caseinilytica]|uniref:Uncharacterized protein n=1 Tax=Nemorincola caseinilytica TaxID=2054315 RepID=A0ABP8NKR5_9BACT